MENLYFYLFIATLMHLIGMVFFGHFEEKTPTPRRLFKVVMMIGLTVTGYAIGEGVGALALSIGAFLIGLMVHVYWCRTHQIHPLTAEPKDRYYQLRGWQ